MRDLAAGSDVEFMQYVRLHSETDRALFHRDHANRLLRLAGRPEQPDLPDFVAIHYYQVPDLIDDASRAVAAHENEACHG